MCSRYIIITFYFHHTNHVIYSIRNTYLIALLDTTQLPTTVLPTTSTAPSTTPAVPKPRCQVPGWHTIQGREIYLSEVYSNAKTLSWFEADSKAEKVGGYLAEITSEEESKIFSEIKTCK